MDVNIILYLSTFWWTAENKPHPSKKTTTQAPSVDPRTIQRRISALERLGFIRREYRPDKDKGNKSNIYHFDGLIAEATPYAEEKIDANKARAEELKVRTARKKPKKTIFTAIEGGKQG